MTSMINRCRSTLSKSQILGLCRVCNSSWTSRGFASGEKLVDVSINKDTDVATVTLQHPPVNSLNLELLQQLKESMDTLEKSECRGMILTSASPTIFCAGLDMMEMYKPKPERVKQFWSTLQDTWLKLYGSSYPTVAAINGHSLAAGCLLALSCEYRIMVGPQYTIGFNEARMGIVAPRWFQDSMRNIIGSRQMELAVTTGSVFKTDEALQMGLIDETAKDKADAIRKAEAFLDGVSSIPPVAHSLAKRIVRGDAISRLANNKEEDMQTFLGYISTPAMQEGLVLYMEMLKNKRKK